MVTSGVESYGSHSLGAVIRAVGRMGEGSMKANGHRPSLAGQTCRQYFDESLARISPNEDLCDQFTFIIVKYGDNLQSILNPRCPVYLLLATLQDKYPCERSAILDLVDMEGHIKNLPERRTEYASNFIVGRQTYILVRINRHGNGGVHYKPLLNDIDTAYPKISEKLSALCVQPVKPSSPSRRFRRMWGDVAQRVGQKMQSPNSLTAQDTSQRARDVGERTKADNAAKQKS